MAEALLLLQLGLPLGLLALGFVMGRIAETRHYRSIHQREENFVTVPTVSIKTVMDPRPVRACELAVGSVVISVDHYKRFLMGFRTIFGGEVRSYSSLLDRGRREALLRMKESCPGAGLFLNCRTETSTISNGKGNATGTVEILAYATAVRFDA